MNYSFKDISNSEIYDSARVLFIFGKYSIFNNVAIDEMRLRCKSSEPLDVDLGDVIEFLDDNSASDFGFERDEDGHWVKKQVSDLDLVLNTVDIETFMRVIYTPSMDGKWFCSVDYSFISSKQKDWIMAYMKNPSDNGKLVLFCTDYAIYRQLLRNKYLGSSQVAHILQLSFPLRTTLEVVVSNVFKSRGVGIEPKAVDLFIMRMSASYDAYEEVIDKIVAESKPIEDDKKAKMKKLVKKAKLKENHGVSTALKEDIKTGITITPEDELKPKDKYIITYNDVMSAMKGIENFVLDDLIDRLLVPLASDKPSSKIRVYKMLGALMDEMGAKKLALNLKSRIDDYIEFRIQINKGVIPVKVKFSVQEAKTRLGPDNRLTRLSDYMFRRRTLTASRTSLKDWLFMKMMLLNIDMYDATDIGYERALYSIVSRTSFNVSRLQNDIGADDILGHSLKKIDSMPYGV